MRISRFVGALTAFVVLAAAPAAAQTPQTRDGFWIGVGMGYGTLGVGCEGCDDLGRTGGLSGYVKVGAALSPSLLVGAETNGWYKNEDGVTGTLGNASAALYFYPKPEEGLFVKGGVGYSRLGLDDGLTNDSDGGLGLVLGAGYDFRLAGNTSLTPVLNYFRGQFDGGSADVFQVGLGVTFH